MQHSFEAHGAAALSWRENLVKRELGCVTTRRLALWLLVVFALLTCSIGPAPAASHEPEALRLRCTDQAAGRRVREALEADPGLKCLEEVDGALVCSVSSVDPSV
jgi:hypothetical protein